MRKYYKVEAELRVSDDLEEAFEFLNSRRTEYGKKFLAEYKEALKTLKTNTLFQVRYSSIRCFPLKTFKYMIHFNVEEETKIIRIYAVTSNYQDPDKHWVK